MGISATIRPPSSGGSATIGTVVAPANQFGNFLRPFAATSLWNSKPVNPKFSSFIIPADAYFPVVGAGSYSTGVFEASSTDGPITVYKNATLGYIRDTDAEHDKDSITIPRWPTSAIPATGGDGHCDVLDTVTGIVHSFWQLKKIGETWTAATYNWTKIDGSGWGSPSHYFQGARAAAVAPIAGLIRKHEINDGQALYKHALAMSLTFTGLCPNPAYIYPATSADSGAAYLNSGKIPEGALVMLPSTFDTSVITDARLKKVAETLKVYGAYVVDQNVGTPFYIYVENGAGFDLHDGSWNQKNADDTHVIRKALRMVVSTDGFVDGNGITTPNKPLDMGVNLLSFRGPQWYYRRGSVKATYNTWKQCLEFPASSDVSAMSDSNGRGFSKVSWAKVAVGNNLKLTANTTGGGQLLLQVWSGANLAFQIGPLKNGENKTFTVPVGAWFVLYAYSGGLGVASTVGGSLVKV